MTGYLGNQVVSELYHHLSTLRVGYSREERKAGEGQVTLAAYLGLAKQDRALAWLEMASCVQTTGTNNRQCVFTDACVSFVNKKFPG